MSTRPTGALPAMRAPVAVEHAACRRPRRAGFRAAAPGRRTRARRPARAARAGDIRRESARSSAGRTSDSISFSSSSLPCPDTWTCLMPSWMTSAPRRARWLITRPIAFSLPGIDRAESTTVSSGARPSRSRWSSMAMRDSADSGSPCDPVVHAQHVLRRIVADLGVADLHAGRDAQVARAAARSPSSASCRGRRRPPCDRTAPPDPTRICIR